MKLYPKQFLGLDSRFVDHEKARVAILPFPYEGGVSYGAGTAKAPDSVIEASHYLELYDEVLRIEPYRAGIITVSPPDIPADHEAMFATVYKKIKCLIKKKKFVVLLGGDHSISVGFAKALKEKHGTLSTIQIDAHADLRDSYQGSKLNHACAMARISEVTPHALQIGLRSMSLEEAERIESEGLCVCTMHDFRHKKFDMDIALENLPDPIFVTVDVDAFDWSVIWSTGTPEPGGFTWDEAMDLLENIFARKRVVGFDVVELSYSETDKNSAFAVAKLIYKMLGFKLVAGKYRGEPGGMPSIAL